jgi:hypothetical protein
VEQEQRAGIRRSREVKLLQNEQEHGARLADGAQKVENE